MHVADEMLSYTCPPEHRGYYELASTIVSDAIKDYRRAKRLAYLDEISFLREFFLSDVFENISGVENPNLFLMKLDAQIDEEIRSGKRRKREKQCMKCNR